MLNKESFKIDSQKFQFKNDSYYLTKINNARVVNNTLIKHVIRIICFGLLTTSVLLAITPEGATYILAPVGMIPGILYALITSKKYELQIEFRNTDETGFQWITVTKSGNKSDLELFDMQVQSLRENIT
ncbi:hypothetical protein [Psychromonas sp. Urea-02u-13]|uniref:hypothetical protein n=1 Tax=Psychromonas sp. Urea-02u-13 TaxID=2058326 RepID=UPI000C33EA5F|nr:hypothetical protein [Psychromonas sp. Urea-02u-13]PKG37032.1 hypothetical protein CXF74_21015 [Psychromonas sp. Urea-02u-13]